MNVHLAYLLLGTYLLTINLLLTLTSVKNQVSCLNVNSDFETTQTTQDITRKPNTDGTEHDADFQRINDEETSRERSTAKPKSEPNIPARPSTEGNVGNKVADNSLTNQKITNSKTRTEVNFVNVASQSGPQVPVDSKQEVLSSTENAFTDVSSNKSEDILSILSNNKESWNNTWPDQVKENQITTIKQTDGQLPLTTNKNGDKVLKFYWLDAWEDRSVNTGVLYLFGKVLVKSKNNTSAYVSCCVVVRNVNRRMYLLPRKYKLDPVTLKPTNHKVTMTDVQAEFNATVATELGLKEFKSKTVTKKYCFNIPHIPEEADYLEVKYSASFPPPMNKIYLTFSHIFGSKTSSLEMLLLDRKIKGPSWLEIKHPQEVKDKVSWCQLEAACDEIEHLSVIRDVHLEPPPVVVTAINMKTTMEPKTRKTKILMLSCVTYKDFPIHKSPPNTPFEQHFTVITKYNNTWPLDLNQTISAYNATKLTICETERELLNSFITLFKELDPDIVVGYDLQGFQEDVLIEKIIDVPMPAWSLLGRLKRPVPSKIAINVFLGRLVSDIKISANSLIKTRSFDLKTLSMNVLKIKEEYPDEALEDPSLYFHHSRDLIKLVSMNIQDTSNILKIMCKLNVIPLALQITQIAGNTMKRTLLGAAWEINDYLLLHAFTHRNYINPDKIYVKRAPSADNTNPDNQQKMSANKVYTPHKKKTTFTGGLVLEPKKGFYEKLILLMDFNSLYPTIIQEYNICFTTISTENNSSLNDDVIRSVLPSPNMKIGILPTIMRKLIESRKEVKKLMKSSKLPIDQYMQYDIKQMALKRIANIMHGQLAHIYSRFYGKHLAKLITMKGREILLHSKAIVEKANFDVLYGDTDSLMIDTNCSDYDSVYNIGANLATEINKKFKHVELDVDAIFKYFLLIKKKSYAATIINKGENGEITYTPLRKGLFFARRDYPQLAAQTGEFILGQILSDKSANEQLARIHEYLNKLKDDLMSGRLPLSMFIMIGGLKENPNKYAANSYLPSSAAVALRLSMKYGRMFKKGDLVPYVICEDGTSASPSIRAYHMKELSNSQHLKLDFNYYLTQHVYPVVSQMCEYIKGVEPAQVKDFLGLIPSGHNQITKRETGEKNVKMGNEKEHDFVRKNAISKTENEKTQKKSLDKDSLRPLDYVEPIYKNEPLYQDPAICSHRTAWLPQILNGGYHPICRLPQRTHVQRMPTDDVRPVNF